MCDKPQESKSVLNKLQDARIVSFVPNSITKHVYIQEEFERYYTATISKEELRILIHELTIMYNNME